MMPESSWKNMAKDNKRPMHINKKLKIAQIEEEMRILFYGPIINDDVVRHYNMLELQWKALTNTRESRHDRR